jgi:hypothetical protein
MVVVSLLRTTPFPLPSPLYKSGRANPSLPSSLALSPSLSSSPRPPRPIAGDPALSVVDTERHRVEAAVEPRIPTSSLSCSYSLSFTLCSWIVIGRTTDVDVLLFAGPATSLELTTTSSSLFLLHYA